MRYNYINESGIMNKNKHRKIRYVGRHSSYKDMNLLAKRNLIEKRLRRITIFTLFLVVFSCLFIGYQKLFLPKIELKGSSVVEVSYLGQYKEAGFLSNYRNKDISSLVKVKGHVNSAKLGEYIIEYSVKYKGHTVHKTRTVRVVDDEKPEITFLNNEKDTLYICPNGKYLFDDYKAIDNYDGDITDKVQVKRIGNKYRYFVTDSFGNSNVVERVSFYQDISKPTVTLDSSLNITLTVGDKFNDSNYSVSDNCDHNVSVKIDGNVDTNTTGTYYRNYVATDEAGNITKVTQRIDVLEPRKNGVIYLTFDDGPRSGTTDIILNILKEEGVKATFFVTNSGPDDLIKRAYNEGHTIGLHTASHDYSVVYASVDSYFSDLEMVSSRVERITGEKSKIIRFPGGSSNTISRRYSPGIMSTLTTEVLNRGYRYYDWNIDSRDAEGGRYNADDIYQFVTSSLSHDKVNMVLMHDIKVTTKDCLRKIIQYGKANGYTFEAISPYTDMVTQRVNN